MSADMLSPHRLVVAAIAITLGACTQTNPPPAALAPVGSPERLGYDLAEKRGRTSDEILREHRSAAEARERDIVLRREAAIKGISTQTFDETTKELINLALRCTLNRIRSLYPLFKHGTVENLAGTALLACRDEWSNVTLSIQLQLSEEGRGTSSRFSVERAIKERYLPEIKTTIEALKARDNDLADPVPAPEPEPLPRQRWEERV
jgi:hypothetical protein